MRNEVLPVEVSCFTRNIPENPVAGTLPEQGEQTRSGPLSGLRIPEEAFEAICQTIREKTRFCLEEPIGSGGTGVVFIARHEELSLRRAIKLMHYGNRKDRHRFIETLTGSLATVARMRHPGLIEIHDYFVTDEFAYVVMDLHNPDRNFRSLTATQAVRNNPRMILETLERIVEVLAYCHSTPADLPIRGSRGVFVHGDLKAENVLIDYRGQPVVTDWLIPNLGRRSEPCFSYDDTRAYGTPMYMPPEQRTSGTITPSSDVWNFGVLAFEAVTGYYPFEQEDDIYTGKAMAVRRFAPFAPVWFDEVISQCLHGDHRLRPDSGQALLQLWRKMSFRPSSGSAGFVADRSPLRRVFLSSTFRELADERDAVRAALQRLGTVACVAMDKNGANIDSPRDACLAAVEQADLFLLILGISSGSLDDVSGFSMTRMEYEHARNSGVPVLSYIKRLSSNDAKHTGQVGSTEFEVDFRVREFIAALDGITHSYFAGPNDLAIQVVCDLARLAQVA